MFLILIGANSSLLWLSRLQVEARVLKRVSLKGNCTINMSCDPNILQLQIMSVWVKIDCNPWPLLNNSSPIEEQGDALQKNPFGSALFTLKMITMMFSSDQLLLRLAASCPPCLWSPFLSRCPGNKARISFQTSKKIHPKHFKILI